MNHRTLLAVSVPEAYKESVLRIQGQVLRYAPVDLVEPQQLFITLNYLGRLDGDTLSRLRGRTLPELFRAHSAFPLELRFVDTMYKRGERSYVFLSPAQGIAQLQDIQSGITDVLNKMNNHQPHRFQPELIIAYMPKSDPETTKQLLDHISDADLSGLEPFTVSSITLFEAFSSKKGEYYQRLAEFNLS